MPPGAPPRFKGLGIETLDAQICRVEATSRAGRAVTTGVLEQLLYVPTPPPRPFDRIDALRDGANWKPVSMVGDVSRPVTASPCRRCRPVDRIGPERLEHWGVSHTHPISFFSTRRWKYWHRGARTNLERSDGSRRYHSAAKNGKRAPRFQRKAKTGLCRNKQERPEHPALQGLGEMNDDPAWDRQSTRTARLLQVQSRLRWRPTI